MTELRKKRITSYYITETLKELISYLIQMEEISKIVFLDRAVSYFFEVDPVMNDEVLITSRREDKYIKRNVLYSNYIYEDQDERLDKYTKLTGCKKSQIIFQTLVNYSAYLLEKNDSFYLKLMEKKDEL